MSYYCKNCKRHVERKTKTGIGFWLFVFLLWLPSLILVGFVMFGVMGAMVTIDYAALPNGPSTMIVILGAGVIWILSPFIIYFARSDKCPICNSGVEK